MLTALGDRRRGPIAEALFGDEDERSLVIVSMLALPVSILAQFFREVMRLTVRPWHYAGSSLVSALAGAAIGILAVTAFDAGPTGVQIGALVGAFRRGRVRRVRWCGATSARASRWATCG